MLTNMKPIWRRRLALLCCLGVMLATLGRTSTSAAPTASHWYVAPNGVDSAACGTMVAPCKRIATAIHNAQPRDTIMLAGGVYTETLVMSKTLTLASYQPLPTVIDGNNADSVIRVLWVTTALTITGITIQHGRAPYGGGIDNFQGGDVRLVGATIVSNTATTAAGGGIFNYGTLSIINSTISSNSALTGGGIATNFGTATITNTTISGNSAVGVAAQGGGGIFAGNGDVALQNTIVAGNMGAFNPDCVGAIVSLGYNLFGSDEGCSFASGTNDQVGTATRPLNPQLGPLRYYGGPTPTYALRTGSPAIDAGNPLLPGSGPAACPAVDQRGVARPQSVNTSGPPRCDIGAYEYDAPIAFPWLYLPVVTR